MCWARTLRLALALACAPALPSGPALASGTPGAALVQAEQAALGRTRLRISLPGQPATTLLVARDDDVPATAAPAGVDVLARVGEHTLVLADRYPSRLNQGAGACGAGEERFLRVVRVVPPPATLTHSLRLASCWKNIELDDEFTDVSGARGWRWTGPARELRIEWFSGPTKHKPEVRRLRIEDDGSVVELPPN